MTPDKLTAVLGLLREKCAGSVGDIVGGARKIVGGTWRLADDAAARAAAGVGDKHPIIAGAIRAAPAGAVAYGGKKAYDSETGQNLRYRYQLWKARRQMGQ